MDPFATLGIEARFDLDVAAVERRFRDLSRAVHPDRHAGATPAERRMALGRAVEVTEAWRVVRDPVRRAEALLGRAGVPVGETAEPKPDAAFLMETMERREELAGARRRGDGAAIGRMRAEARARESEVLGALGRGFDAAGGERARLGGVVPLLGRLRYERRYLEELDAAEEGAPAVDP